MCRENISFGNAYLLSHPVAVPLLHAIHSSVLTLTFLRIACKGFVFNFLEYCLLNIMWWFCKDSQELITVRFLCSWSIECYTVWAVNEASYGFENDRTIWKWIEIVSTGVHEGPWIINNAYEKGSHDKEDNLFKRHFPLHAFQPSTQVAPFLWNWSYFWEI